MDLEKIPTPDEAKWHHLAAGEVTRLLGCDPRTGLDDAEAARRLKHFGPNLVTDRGGMPAWKRFLLQFHPPLIYILLAACAITSFLHEWVDSSVIFGVVVINAIIGFIQESKAERSIEALSRMLVTETTVRRAGRKLRLPSGDRVPADLRLFDVHNLHCDESSLTGESLPVGKHADPLDHDIALADRKNQAYAGTLVTAGLAEGLVWLRATRRKPDASPG